MIMEKTTVNGQYWYAGSTYEAGPFATKDTLYTWVNSVIPNNGSSVIGHARIEIYDELGGNVDSLKFFVVLAVTRRITDLASVLYGGGSSGLKPDVLDMMRESREHFHKVHDILEEYTGIRIAELDKILEDF